MERGDVFIIGFPKSGNTWLRSMLSRAYQLKYGLRQDLMLKTDELARADARVPRFCVTNGHLSFERVVREAFADPAQAARLGQPPLIFLTRHPGDVAVSWYIQFTKRVSPGKRELINAGLKEPVDHENIGLWEFVMHPEIGLPCIIDFMNQWEPIVRDLPRHLITGYEDLRTQPLESLTEIAAFAGLDLSQDELRQAVDFGSFENLQQLERSGFFKQGGMSLSKVRDGKSFKVRRGKVLGYRDDLSAEQREQLDALIADSLSPTLGYRTDTAAVGA